ncbi:hypothetical protein [Maricaulis sp. CAU 1757]
MGNPAKEKKLTDDKEKLKTVPEDVGAEAEPDTGQPGHTRQEQLETPSTLGEKGRTGTPSSSGGDLARDIGTRDEKKRAIERPAGATRVQGADEKID